MASGSFVTEVLAHSGRLEKEHLSTKISRLSQRVDEVKGEVCDMINKKYEEFLPSLQSAEDLVSQVDSLSSDIDLLKSRIENEVQRDLHVAAAEFTELKQQLEKNTVVLSVLKELQEFDAAIEKYSCKVSKKDYIAAAEHLEKAQSSLRALNLRKGTELQLLKGLGIELTLQKENLLYHLGEEWKQLVVWKLPPAKESEGVMSALKTELHLYTRTPTEERGSGSLLISVLQALSIVGQLNTKLKLFSQILLKYILRPLISYPCLHTQIEWQTLNAILRFESLETDLEHPAPMVLFLNIISVFQFIHQHLLVPLDLSVESEDRPELVLAEVLGDMIWKELSECLIKDCLVYSIPATTSMLEQYEEVIQATEVFENELKKMQFLKGDATDLLKYARNVNAHFASKKCQDVIVVARNLMTSEIHNTVKIIPELTASITKLPALPAGDKLKQLKESKTAHNEMVELESRHKLGQHTFALPACRISESVQNLMDLAYQTLSDATSSSTHCAIQLFYTVRNIFHLFHDVVPTYHKENLQKLPQLSAIHHNNCMFIAHHLLTLGHQFKYHLPSPLCDGAATFVDLVPGFRRLGTESFLAQMRIQKGELLERLASARNFSNLDDEANHASASKALRQVLHQLKRLGTVWQDVLPVYVYCKAMGTLLNTAVTEIIGKITALEDISAEDGDRLYALCHLVTEEGPQVFTPLLDENKNKKYQEEVPVYVKKWVKIKELMVILQANLQELVERWADGKGPLANEFSTTEMKNLIRALFQNTDRRATALAKIK